MKCSDNSRGKERSWPTILIAIRISQMLQKDHSFSDSRVLNDEWIASLMIQKQPSNCYYDNHDQKTLCVSCGFQLFLESSTCFWFWLTKRGQYSTIRAIWPHRKTNLLTNAFAIAWQWHSFRKDWCWLRFSTIPMNIIEIISDILESHNYSHERRRSWLQIHPSCNLNECTWISAFLKLTDSKTRSQRISFVRQISSFLHVISIFEGISGSNKALNLGWRRRKARLGSLKTNCFTQNDQE
jgi:hypothetical protein